MLKQINTLVLNEKKNLTKPVIFNQVEYSDDCDGIHKLNTFFIDSTRSMTVNR